MKELSLPVSELKTALAGFNKVVSSKSVLPVLGCLRVQPVPDGVDLQVTDLDSFATFRISMDAPADFPPSLVSLGALAKVAKTSQDRITLIHEGDQRMKVRQFIGTHPVEQPIDCLTIEDWPTVPQIKTEPFQVDPGFKEAFRHAMECASADSTRVILNGVCLDLTQPACHCLAATDGRHLFSANTFHFSLAESAVIPNRKFLNWSGFAEDGPWSLAVEPPVLKEQEVVTPAYVQMQSEHWTFLTNGIHGSYPNWRQVMPSPERQFTKVTVSELAVGAILDALPRMPGSDESDQSVTLVVQGGNLLLRSRPRFTDQWAEIPVPGGSVAGSDTQICLNRSFITKALRFGFTEFEVQDALSPIVFTAPGKKMVAMPMRFNDVTATSHTDSSPSPESPQEAVTPTEAAPVAPRLPQDPDNKTEQNTAMPINNITTLPAPARGHIKPPTTDGHNGENPTGMKAVVESVERIKINLRDAIGDLNDTLDLLKAAEKEKKATLKEVESVQATLRSLQKVEL